MALTPSQHNRRSRRDFNIRMAMAVLVIVFAWVLVEYTSLLYKRYQIELKKNWFIEENERLVNRNSDLERQYEYYKTDYFFRKEAKRKLNKKESGENIVIVTGGEEKIRSQNDWEIREDMMGKWWEFLFGSMAEDSFASRVGQE